MDDSFHKTEMETLVSALNKLVQRGYTDDFKITHDGLKSLKTEKVYTPGQIKVTDFYRFEGTSDPADESILYGIETDDGVKGTLVDAFGPSSDPKVAAFMQQVDEISKRNTGKK